MNDPCYTVIVPARVTCVITCVTAHSAVAGTIYGCEASSYGEREAKVTTVTKKGIENTYKHFQTSTIYIFET